MAKKTPAELSSPTPATSKPARPRRAAATKAASAEPKVRTAKAKVARPVAPTPPEVELVKGRFTLPQADFERLSELKRRAKELGRTVKKNQLFRIGLSLVSTLSDEALLIALDQLAPAKPAKTRR